MSLHAPCKDLSSTKQDCYGFARAPETIEKNQYGRFKNVYLYITEKCQLRCGHCYMGKRLDGEVMMSKEKIFSTLTFWRKMGGSKLSILGGEPTMHPDFIEICRYAKQLGYEKVILNTNGLRQTLKQLNQMDPQDFSYVQVSLDGGSPSTHDLTRGNGTFNIALNTTKILAERGFDTRVICTVNKQNRKDCLDLISICEEAKVSLLKFHIFSTIGTGKKNEEWGMTSREWIEFYTSLDGRNHDGKLQVWYQPTYATREMIKKYTAEGYKGCIGRTLDRISIFPDGRAYVCSYLFDTNLNMFTVKDDKPVLNKGENEFDLFCSAMTNERCGHCHYSKSCMGGCPAEELIEGASACGDDHEIVPVCRLWKSAF